MDAEKVILSVLLLAIPLPAMRGSEFYLGSVGPSPLRFAQSPSSKPYVWPKGPTMPTNNFSVVTDSVPGISTNLTAAPAVSSAQITNSVASMTRPAPDMASSLLPQPQPGVDTNSLSASNLLLVTPQMLADFFKANLEMMSRWSTNGPAVPEIPFNPPTPKPPSSEAIYKTQ